MATNLTLPFLIFILAHLPITTLSDDGTCPYPCYPPPTGTGGTPSPPASQTGSFPPPAGTNYPTPTGNFPYYPSPPFGNNYYGPPPPDPILPYFPFYYRKPPHQTDNSSAASLSILTLFIVTVNFFAFIFLFDFSL